MKMPTSMFVFSTAGCFSAALLQAAFPYPTMAADNATTVSLLQQPSMAEAVAKARLSGTSPIVTNPSALFLTAQKGQNAVGTLTLQKSGTDQHTYYLSTSQSWVLMNPPYGSTRTLSTETDQLVITAQTSNLSPGSYSAVVYVVDSGPNNFTNMLRIPVMLTVTATPVAASPVAAPPAPSAVTPPPPPAATPPPPPTVATTGIVASPMALTLTAQKGQNAVGTLALRKGGTDQHSYYLSTNQSWVLMNPPYGSTQTLSTETDQLVITAQTSNLSPGSYSAIVYVVDSGPNNFTNMLRIPVMLTVTATPVAASPVASPPAPSAVTPPPPPAATPPPPAPPAPASVATTSIQVSPASLALTSANSIGTLTLRKAGTDQHSYYLSTSQSWVLMNPPYGSTQTITSETDQLVITAQAAGLAAGTYSAVVYIVDSGPNNYSNTIRIPVTFTVSPNQTAASSLQSSNTPAQPVSLTPPPPPSPPAPTPSPTSSALRVASATVSWIANTESDLAGYRVYVGTSSGTYNFAGPFEVAGGTSFTVPNLPVGTTYYFAVSAFDKAGNESTKSAEVSKSLF